MNSDELRQYLRPRAGGPLPKDRRLDHAAVADFPLRYRRAYQRVERGILHACMAEGAATKWQALALKVANCTPRRPCREAAICWWCKARMGLAEAEAMIDHFPASARRKTISVITIILAVVPLDEVDETRSLVKAFPRYWRRLCRAWPNCRWRGRMELDLLTGHPRQELGLYARKTLLALDYHPEESGPSIGIHAHVVLHHPGISRSRVAGSLSMIYPAFRQVMVTGTRETQELLEALARCGSYAVKARPPSFALAGRGSRTCRPRHPRTILTHVDLHRRFHPDDLLVEGG